jgi:DeoR/GlpR family transcriptional regulator of sugar metabolism
MSSTSKRVELLPARRQAMILEHLRTHGATAIGELAVALGGSQSTVRRDLEHLVKRGYLERTHGGAVLVPPALATFEREPSITAQLRHPQKVAIGHAAAAMLNPGESVVFEASTTVLEAARAASARGIPLAAITNSLDIALICSAVPAWRVIMPGGTLRPGSRSLVGDLADSFFKNIHADICFIGAGAITHTVLTDTSFEISALKRAMIQSSRRTILLADSSKFTTPAFCTFGDLSMIDEIVTDDEVDAGGLATLRSLHANVHVVSVAGPPI